MFHSYGHECVTLLYIISTHTEEYNSYNSVILLLQLPLSHEEMNSSYFSVTMCFHIYNNHLLLLYVHYVSTL